MIDNEYEPKIKKMNVYRSNNTKYAAEDEDYYDNLKNVKPVCATIDELLEFYNTWTRIYKEVSENWESADTD